ncbi:MAG: hypothetical protein P4L64_17630 [Caulobacteraceae bacterium]|nr:hypothetical protein [Caulobacteraceae bacterium]
MDLSVLNNYYLAKAGIISSSSSSGTSSSGTSSTASTTAAPTPPWNATNAATQTASLLAKSLEGQSVINPNAAKLDVKGASSDYKSLFTLYQGLNTLQGLTADMLAKGATTVSKEQATKAFATGLSQVNSYVNGLSLDHMRLTLGTVATSDSTTIAPPTENDSYTTGVIFSGGINDPAPAFAGDVKFDINVSKVHGAKSTVSIDLSQMGSTPRTVPNVVNYINSQLKAAGIKTQFATSRQPGVAQTVTSGKTKITLPAGPDQWSLKVNGDSAEQIAFSAPATADAVYVSQTSGNPSGAKDVTAPIQQLAKFQTTNSATTTPPPAALVQSGTINSVAGEAFAKTLGPEVGSIHASATAADGSVYVVANITGKTDGQTIQGSQDVALLKYDSAGQLQYTRTLGASGSASGYALAVAADGSVAVAGSITGALDAQNLGNSTSSSDSFVSVYNAKGEEQWTQMRGSLNDDQANAVAFGSDGSVYIAGQTTGSMPGAKGVGGQDGYLAGFSSTGKALFTTQFGTTGSDAATSLAVDGSTVVVGGVENGHGVVRGFTLNSTGAPTAGTVRDLGDLQGGSIAGVAISNGQVVVAGNTKNPALNAGAVTAAASGGQDAFVAQLSENLTAASTDAVAYYGGTGADTVSGLAVSNGKVYITGSSSGGLPNLANQGTKEGYVANIDVASGAVNWSQAIKGQDGYDAPGSIAVASGGASVLDRLGLPTGTLQYTGSQLLTASSSVRAGDQFQIRTAAGATPVTVTISADETADSLALKIKRATGFAVNATVLPSSNKEEVKITPQNTRQVVELLPGPSGKDALNALGLSPGVVQKAPAIATSTAKSTNATKNTYGLNIAQDFDLTTTAGITAAQTAIKTAMAKVQTAYYDLVNANKPKTPTSTVTGTVPAYLTSEISNYQAALDRLTGGSSSSSSSASPLTALLSA